MINSLKTIAVFGCSLTSRYREDLCKSFITVAKELGVNIVFFNSLGKVGKYGDYEFELLNDLNLDSFDGIVFDGEGYNVEGMGDKVANKLREAKCPIISISTYVEGFYNICFDDMAGIRILVEHFIDVHHFTNIGFMAGYLTHPDARARLKAFRDVMKSRGLPEDGAGVFEGDFWFRKGEEAADYFLSRPERPEAIVCANDYMAISLTTALKRRGIAVPDDIAVSGFDGTAEGQEFLPHITSASRERPDIARKSLKFLLGIGEDGQHSESLTIYPNPIYAQSCGCVEMDYQSEAENINQVYEINRNFGYNLYDAQSLILKLNKVNTVEEMEKVFNETSVNFGDFSSFFLMLHTDENGRTSYDSDYICPSGRFTPVMWIDRKNVYIRPKETFDLSEIIPYVQSEKPHFYYVSSVHCAERIFGYATIEMVQEDIYNEFFNLCLLNLAVTLETLLKNDRISKLIGTLETLSIRDDLTGMLNRRGFEELSQKVIGSFDRERLVCTMVIDMDGLKYINDEYGHYEGDCAIRTVADIITKCCDAGENAGRVGGDEFYIFAAEYSQKKLMRFLEKLENQINSFNSISNKPYNIQVSYGTNLTTATSQDSLESLIKVSDSRMYEQKKNKPNRRK